MLFVCLSRRLFSDVRIGTHWYVRRPLDIRCQKYKPHFVRALSWCDTTSRVPVQLLPDVTGSSHSTFDQSDGFDAAGVPQTSNGRLDKKTLCYPRRVPRTELLTVIAYERRTLSYGIRAITSLWLFTWSALFSTHSHIKRKERNLSIHKQTRDTLVLVTNQHDYPK